MIETLDQWLDTVPDGLAEDIADWLFERLEMIDPSDAIALSNEFCIEDALP